MGHYFVDIQYKRGLTQYIAEVICVNFCPPGSSRFSDKRNVDALSESLDDINEETQNAMLSPWSIMNPNTQR